MIGPGRAEFLTAMGSLSVVVGLVFGHHDAALPAGDRDVLLLIAWEQLTYEEVSRALAIPVGTVQSRLHRARMKVREALAGTDAAATYEELTTNE